ncbi:hypothetical protein [Magnetospirillum sp. 15-1]|uniref:hypothetical protein n=1 Tax=Magnetospirillum sp. 15-1 TaxID=1979370 RepID=UPI001143CA8C|nr:hypothetical protein [Magnetospirillum sp. 15-1]
MRVFRHLSPRWAGGNRRHLAAVLLAVWAMLGQTLIPAFHHHDGGLAGWHQAGGSDLPGQDGDDDCPICQAAHTIGTAALPGGLALHELMPAALPWPMSGQTGHPGRHRNDRPRQRAPPSPI